MTSKFNEFDMKMALAYLKAYDDLSESEILIETYRHFKRCVSSRFSSDEAKKLLKYTNHEISKKPKSVGSIMLKTCKYIVENSHGEKEG